MSFQVIHSPLEGTVGVSRRERIEATSEGSGDKSWTWKFLGHGASDQFSFRTPSLVNPISPMFTGAIIDAEYSRAMFGNLSFFWPLFGFIMGIVAIVNTKGWAIPPAFPIFAIIIAIGVIDALGGMFAFIPFSLGVLFTGHLNSVYALMTLFAIAVMWYSGAQISHKLRPLRRHHTRSGFDRFWHIAGDCAIDIILAAFIIGALLELMPLLSHLDLEPYVHEHIHATWLIVALVMAFRLLLQGASMLFYPRRLLSVEHASPRPRNRYLTLFFVLGIQMVFVISALYIAMGWRWQLWAIAICYFLLLLAERIERDFPKATWIRRLVPVSLSRILIAIIVGQLAARYFIESGVKTAGELTGGIFLVVAIMLLVFSVLEKFEGDPWSDHPIWKLIGFSVVTFLAVFGAGWLTLY